MVYGVLSDVHSNLEGLRAVLDQLDEVGTDRILFLGDAVGYGADPNACVRLLAARASISIRGNHDRVVANHEDGFDYSSNEVRIADVKNREMLDAECLSWVRGLPGGPVVVDGCILVCHGSPSDEDAYLFSLADMSDAVSVLRRTHPGVRVCLFGHTHVATVIQDGRKAVGGVIGLSESSVYLANPGSVGQPRDGDPRASFGILDTGRWRYRNYRVDYDVGAAQRKIRAVGMPEVFARRLGTGR